MQTAGLDVRDPRAYLLVGVVFLLHAVHFAGETTGPRAELWLAASLLWLSVAYVLRRRQRTATIADRN